MTSVYICIYASIYSYIRQERVLCVRLALTSSTHVCTYGEKIYQHIYIDMHKFMYPREFICGWGKERVMETVFVCMNCSHLLFIMSKSIDMSKSTDKREDMCEQRLLFV